MVSTNEVVQEVLRIDTDGELDMARREKNIRAGHWRDSPGRNQPGGVGG
jgi:hypothetical protein